MESSLASFILGDLVLSAFDGKLAIFDTVGITSELVSKCRFDEVIRTSFESSADQNLPDSRTVEAPLARILCEIVKAYYDIPNLAITVFDGQTGQTRSLSDDGRRDPFSVDLVALRGV